jgi:L-fuconolactonase
MPELRASPVVVATVRAIYSRRASPDFVCSPLAFVSLWFVRVIDTHAHTGLDRWEPIETLRFHLRGAGVQQAVLVQHAGGDNEYLLACLRRFPGEFGVTLLVERDTPDDVIRDLAGSGARGIRLNADWRSTGDDPLRHWRLAGELDLIVSTSSMPPILGPLFREALETFPRLCVVLEHLAGAKSRPPTTVDEFKLVMQLARHRNLHVKVQGFGEWCPLPLRHGDVPPFFDMVLAAFGPDRMMWGSDFPLVCTREGYAQALKFALEYAGRRVDQAGVDAIFHATAARLYRL